MDRAKGSKDGSAGYRISSDVDVNLVWRDPSSKDDQLIQLVVNNPTAPPPHPDPDFADSYIEGKCTYYGCDIWLSHLAILTECTTWKSLWIGVPGK